MQYNLFKDLLNQQVCCYFTDKKTKKTILKSEAIDLLMLMYPGFKVVKSEFEIERGVPFIYIGKPDYIYKVKERLEPHIIVSKTGIYDLTDRDTLINLAYSKHNNGWESILIDQSKWGTEGIDKKGRISPDYLFRFNVNDYTTQGKQRPKYLSQDFINSWTEDQFMNNFKYLWVTGSVIDKDVEADKLFLDMLSKLNNPPELLYLYLKFIDNIGIDYLERKLLNFIDMSQNPPQNVSKFMLQTYTSFRTTYKANVPYAIDRLLKSSVDNKSLRLLNLLLSLTARGVIS